MNHYLFLKLVLAFLFFSTNSLAMKPLSEEPTLIASCLFSIPENIDTIVLEEEEEQNDYDRVYDCNKYKCITGGINILNDKDKDLNLKGEVFNFQYNREKEVYYILKTDEKFKDSGKLPKNGAHKKVDSLGMHASVAKVSKKDWDEKVSYVRAFSKISPLDHFESYVGTKLVHFYDKNDHLLGQSLTFGFAGFKACQ